MKNFFIVARAKEKNNPFNIWHPAAALNPMKCSHTLFSIEKSFDSHTYAIAKDATMNYEYLD